MLSHETKNSLAKCVILIWILLLIWLALLLARYAISFDVNEYFGFQEKRILPVSIVTEVKLILLMLSVSIMGGISFIIKDFYRANKYANIYDVAYQDYLNKKISFDQFQNLVTVEVYIWRFNHTWVFWFLVQPILSSFLGIIAFSIARSGLGVLQWGSTALEITIQNIYLYGVFTFLAGFSSHKFIAWLDRLADKIFSTTLPEKTLEKREMVKEAASMDRLNLKENIQDEFVWNTGVDSLPKYDKILEQKTSGSFSASRIKSSPASSTDSTKIKPIR